MEMTISNQYDYDLEAAVLGAIMLEKNALERVISDLKPSLFYEHKNQLICKAILDLHKNSEVVDLLTVAKRIHEDGYSNECNAYYIANLSNRVASSANMEFHIKILQQMFLLRFINGLGYKMQTASIQPDADGFELISRFSQALAKLEASVLTKGFDTVETLYKDFLLELEARRSGATPSGISWGLDTITKNIGGANNSDLILIAARPGMGKTALMLKIARNCVYNLNKPCAIFSLEMSSSQLLTRIVSAECQIDSMLLKSNNIGHAEINVVAQKLQELKTKPLYIDDTGGLNIYEFENKARKLVEDFGVEFIIIDYLQLLTTTEFRNDKNNQISFISSRIKATAKKLNIPIIALSQLSREVEKRPSKRPQMSDLRDSGSLEQDADLIFFLFRPEYYGVDEIEVDGYGTISSKGKAILELAKNRHGKLFTEMFDFINQFTDFQDINKF